MAPEIQLVHQRQVFVSYVIDVRWAGAASLQLQHRTPPVFLYKNPMSFRESVQDGCNDNQRDLWCDVMFAPAS